MNELKGYDYSEVKKGKIVKNKYKLVSEVDSLVNRDELNEKMMNAVTNKGHVYFIKKKGLIHGVVIFKFEEHYANEFEIDETTYKVTKVDAIDKNGEKIMDKVVEFDNKNIVGTKKMKEKELAKRDMANAYVCQDFIASSELKKLENIVMLDLFDYLKLNSAFEDNGVKVLMWGDNITADRTIGKTSSSAISIGMCMGVGIGALFGELLFDNIGTGMCLGICFGMFFGAAYYAFPKKKENK